MQHRLLIVKCYARKCGGPEPIPAGDRYNGPLWQVWRRFEREAPKRAGEINIHALTGAFGLISAGTPVPLVDQTMSPLRADELRSEVLATFQGLMARGYQEVCLALSRRYLRALEGWEGLVPKGTTITYTDGPMGTKLAQLRAWLEGDVWNPAPKPLRLEPDSQTGKSARLGGLSITLTREAVCEVARCGLRQGEPGATSIRRWSVPVDGVPVSPKWLVSQITGLPAATFQAADARRLLLALGLAVERSG